MFYLSYFSSADRNQTGDPLSIGPNTGAAEMSDKAAVDMMAKNEIADVVESLLSAETLPVLPSYTQLPTPGPPPSTSSTTICITTKTGTDIISG